MEILYINIVYVSYIVSVYDIQHVQMFGYDYIVHVVYMYM